VFGIVSDNIEPKEALDFALVNHFDLTRKFVNDNVAGFDRRAGDKHIVDIDAKDDVSAYVDAGVRFEDLESQAYNHF
jgi:hypothetical protein